MTSLPDVPLSADCTISRHSTQTRPLTEVTSVNVDKPPSPTQHSPLDKTQLDDPKSDRSSLSKDRKVNHLARQKKNRKRNSYSKSPSSERSRKKEKRAKKHRRRTSQPSENKGRSSRSRSARRRSRHRRDDRDRDQRPKRRNSSQQRPRDPKDRYVRKDREDKPPAPVKQVPKMPDEVPYQDLSLTYLPGQKRRRQRSRSPRDYYRKNNGGNDTQFWDSFSWVPKLNYISNASSSAIINTKKMRRMQITNMPLEMGLTSDDINQVVTQFMIRNYLTDNMNTCPVVKIDVSEADRSVAIELSSVEETCKICKLEKFELFKGCKNNIIRLGDSMYGSSLVNQAQTAAKAQAAAFAAISILQNKGTTFDVRGGMLSIQSSCVLRVVNAVTAYMSQHLTEEESKEYYDDLVEGFSEFGKVKHSWLVKKSQRIVAAEPGNLFIQFQTRQQAEKSMENMQDRCFDERTIKLYFVPDSIYENYFKPASK